MLARITIHAPRHRNVRRTFRYLGTFAASLVALALCCEPSSVHAQYASVPWPAGDPPTASELDAMVAAAVELADREQAEEFLEAAEPGEQSEHIRAQQTDIDAGRWDREALFRFGDSLFEHVFRDIDGYGAHKGARHHRVHEGDRGGPDTFACADCHSVAGADGGGTRTQNAFLRGDGNRMSSALVRNPPHVLGLGLVQALAAEMSIDLRRQRLLGLEGARNNGEPVRVDLRSKGVAFGFLVANSDGTTDYSGVDGVDPDLIVKPFGWKGEFSRLRRFIEDAGRVHFGVQSHVLTIEAKQASSDTKLGDGADWFDPDGDGVSREIEEGSLTATALYLAMLEAPVILPPQDTGMREKWARGLALFEEVGCANCHRPDLDLTNATWEEAPDTTGAKPYALALLRDGDQPKGTNRVRLFSDLKRHAMGSGLADAFDAGPTLKADVFLTRPLWGLADTAPYMHDGRASTVADAVLAHGGEAQASADLFRKLSPEDGRAVSVFLLSLTRTPRVRVAR